MSDQIPDDVTAMAERFRAGIISRDKLVQKRLVEAYRQLYARLQDKITLLTDVIDGPLSKSQILNLARYKSLMSGVEDELANYSIILQNELSQAARAEVARAVREARHVVAAAVAQDGGRIALSEIAALNPRVVETLLGFLEPDGELWKRIETMPDWTAANVSDTIIEGVTIGQGPKTIAKNITRTLGGSLTDAMRMTRTVQLWSYREASRATYSANSDIVTEWMWNANLDGRTCPSCVSQHGKTFPLDQPLNDHYNGRCFATPVTVLNPDRKIESGDDWFKKQPEATQREILGKGRYEAWKNGEFQLSDITRTVKDPVYGSMKVPKPLKDLG